MFAIKKTLTPLILPPGIVILAVIAIALIMMHRRQRQLGWVNLIVALALWALSVTPVSSLLVRGLEAPFAIPPDPSGDVIILLGGGVIQDVPDMGGRSSAPACSTLGRIVAAARLYRQARLPILVSGGSVDGRADTSAAIIAGRFLEDLGVPAHDILIEDRARDTQENARLSAAICRRRGFTRPILLTAAYHLRRAVMAFDAAGLRVTPFPAYYLGSPIAPFQWPDLLPRAGALHVSALALHEYAGIVYYRLTGR